MASRTYRCPDCAPTEIALDQGGLLQTKVANDNDDEECSISFRDSNAPFS